MGLIKRFFIFIIIIFLTSPKLFSQDSIASENSNFIKRYWNNLIHGNIDRSFEKALDMSFAIAPTYSQEGSLGIGCSASGLYRLDKSDKNMNPSNISLEVNTSLNGFFYVLCSGVNYFKDKRSSLIYNVWFTRKNLNFWGISFDNCNINPTSKYLRFQYKIDADYNYRLGKNFFLGGVLYLNYTKANNILNPNYLEGQKDSYYMTGLGLSFQIDTRDNRTNPQKGIYLLIREVAYADFLGTADMTNWATTVILSGYKKLWKGGLIAGDFYSQFNNENVPWIVREEVGGVIGRMRGYYSGRYIDACQMAAQIELRQHLYKRFGCVAWIGAGTVFPSIEKFQWKNILPNYSLGIRFEFKHNVNLRMDFGFGEDAFGFVFGFSEAF